MHYFVRFISSIVAVSLACVAGATPPRISGVTEQAVGANADYFYSLRSLWDNSGMYNVDARDIFLVEIDMRTGELNNYWPVRSSTTIFEEGFPGSVVETGRLSDFVNPYDILREKNAAPLESSPIDQHLGYKFKNGDLITNYNDPTGDSGAKTLITASELPLLLASSHMKILDLYPPLDNDMERDMGGNYIGPPSIEENVTCVIKETTWKIGEYGGETIVPLLLSCPEDEWEWSFNLWVFVPDWHSLKK